MRACVNGPVCRARVRAIGVLLRELLAVAPLDQRVDELLRERDELSRCQAVRLARSPS